MQKYASSLEKFSDSEDARPLRIDICDKEKRFLKKKRTMSLYATRNYNYSVYVSMNFTIYHSCSAMNKIKKFI